jgi:hypothetical protein
MAPDALSVERRAPNRIALSYADQLSARALGSNEFPRCESDFGGKQFKRRRIVCGKNEAGGAVDERNFRQVLGQLLGWPIEQ